METTAPPATVPETVVGPGMAPSKPMVTVPAGPSLSSTWSTK